MDSTLGSSQSILCLAIQTNISPVLVYLKQVSFALSILLSHESLFEIDTMLEALKALLCYNIFYFKVEIVTQ